VILRRRGGAASAADVVRGYEDVKLRNVTTYVTRLNALGVDTMLCR
jgi:indolepyruvate ferredoxin oxidoreductase